MAAWKERPLLLVCALLFGLVAIPLTYTPHRISLQISGASKLNVYADRAELSLLVSSEGTKQRKVADEIRQTTDEILSLLRPLTILPTTHNTTLTTNIPPISTLSVNTFSSAHRRTPGVIGERTTFTSSISITAEFQSLTTTTHNHTTFPGSDFRHLSLILPSLAKLPRVRIEYLKWFMSSTRLRELESTARREAVSDALRKIQDFVGPMNLKFPAMRCMTFREQVRKDRVQPSYAQDIDDGVRRSMMEDAAEVMMSQDELGGGGGGGEFDYGYEIERNRIGGEVFGLEPQCVVVESQVDGDWTVVERDVVRTLLGILF